MKIKTYNRAISKLLLLVITLSILLSTLVSCNLFAYVAGEKAEIKNNIENTPDTTQHKYVAEYLRDWGFPVFDKLKFQYFEECFLQLYNYENGLPTPITHAKKTAKLFLDSYYDEIDRSNKTAVTDALLDCYVSVLDDPYTAYRPPVQTEDYLTNMSGSFGGIGVIVEYNDADKSIMIGTVYPDSPAEKAGVKVGDFIYAVDGIKVSELKNYTDAVYYVRGQIGTEVQLQLLRDGEIVTVTATRAKVEEQNVVYQIDNVNNIGYVRIVAFKDNTFPQFKEAIDALEIAGVDGIIFDLRENPGGKVNSVVDVISYLIPDGNTIMSYQYKGRDLVEIVAQDDGEDHKIDLPVVVICNKNTASAGEIFTAAVRDYREDGLLTATIVGTKTYAKGIMQNTYTYPGDDSTVTFTVAYYNPPCGENYHGIGVTPDIYVELTSEGDAQYDCALIELLKLIK